MSQMRTIARTPEIPVERTELRGGIPMVVGVMKAGELRNNYTVPRRDTRNDTGYQREISTTRVNKLIKGLKENVDLPTSILLNLRTFNPAEHLIERDGRSFFSFRGELLHVVDGQHRVEALARLVDENEEKWGGFELPFVCLLGAKESEEMKQFYVVNSTAKSVRTDLAFDLLKQRAENEPGLKESLIETGESWKVKGQEPTEDLTHTPVWRNVIRFPGEQKGGTTIQNAGMVNSLKPLLSTPYFGAMSHESQIRVLDAYWRGVRRVLPEPFDNPTDYALQKGVGVMTMHSLLVSVLEHIRSRGRSVVDPEVYADVLGDVLPKLEGDTSTGELATGADFWLSGEEGAAGSYSSSAGRRVLTAKLRAQLPAIEVE